MAWLILLVVAFVVGMALLWWLDREQPAAEFRAEVRRASADARAKTEVVRFRLETRLEAARLRRELDREFQALDDERPLS